jgi:kynurenine formamidase
VDYQDCDPPNLFRVQKIETKAGAGTHMDAPSHCFSEGKAIDVLDLKSLLTDCVVICVDHEADANYKVMPETVEDFEREHGKIQPNTFVIFYTGWDKYWNNPKKYRNNLQFPSVDETTATLLLRREVSGIGIDTLSPDAGGKDYPVHRVILGAGKYLVENVANAKSVPSTGAKIIVMPMKIKDGTEAPIRLIAVVS